MLKAYNMSQQKNEKKKSSRPLDEPLDEIREQTEEQDEGGLAVRALGRPAADSRLILQIPKLEISEISLDEDEDDQRNPYRNIPLKINKKAKRTIR